MDRESVAKLKLDRRLQSRRGWITSEELEQALETLPDAADKMYRGDDEPSGAEGSAPPATAD